MTARVAKDGLIVENLSISFEGFQALKNVSLEVRPGQILAIIGPNGAGKSTLLDVISGLSQADSGRILFKGRDLSHLSESQIVLSGIARKFQTPSIFPGLDIRSNIALCLRGSRRLLHQFFVDRRAREEKVNTILNRIGLAELADQAAMLLSHGQKQWLEIGMILAMDPDVIMLDEPVTGMTEAEMQETTRLIKDLAREHAVLVIDHDMSFIRSLEAPVMVLHQGSLLFHGSMDEVESSSIVREVYLGESHAHRH